MTILAQLSDGLEVEITGVYKTGNRTRVAVRALSGNPFTMYTMGGPVATDAAMVDADMLTHIRQTNQYGTIRRSRQAGASLPELVRVPMADELPAAAFPVRSRRQPWKNENGD